MHAKLGFELYLFFQGNELRMFIMVLVVFLLAYGVASQGLLYFERSADWVILKDVIYFPYWQLYGEIELDEIACKYFNVRFDVSNMQICV